MKTLTVIVIAVSAAILQGQKVLMKGAGDSTFYYDINGGGTCGPANHITNFPETDGYGMCEWYNPNPKRIKSYGTNSIVAMPNQVLRANLAAYCGKRVVVTINGRRRDDLDLRIWDGCEACNANNGLDFSSSMFATLFGKDRCAAGRIKREMSWEIVDVQAMPFVRGARTDDEDDLSLLF